MSLALRRFEIVLVFLIGILLAAIWSFYYFAPGALEGPLFLIPRPVVSNEREAVLDTLARSSQPSTQGEVQRLDALQVLAATSSASVPSRDDRLKVLEQLSENR